MSPGGLAVAGYRAVAVDFLSPSGGTPANEDAAREAIGKLSLDKSVSDAVAMLDELAQSSRGGKVGAVGFCWGGGFVNRLAVAAGDKLDAGVSFYGPAPAPSEASKVQAPLAIQLAGLDDRVNGTGFPWVTALREAGQDREILPLRRGEPRLPQRHVGRALRQGGGRSGVEANPGLLPAASRLARDNAV